MTGPSLWLFGVAATLAVAGALGTVLARRPLRAAMGLIVHLVALAGLYLTLQAELLAAIQVIVYAGAIVVLFIFVIMMIGPAVDSEPDVASAEPGTQQAPRPAGFVARLVSLFALGMFGSLTILALARVPTMIGRVPKDYGTVEGLGKELFQGGAVAFELVSITLLVAVVAAVTIARGRTRAEADAARQRTLAKQAEAQAKLDEERRLAAEVSAHGGH